MILWNPWKSSWKQITYFYLQYQTSFQQIVYKFDHYLEMIFFSLPSYHRSPIQLSSNISTHKKENKYQNIMYYFQDIDLLSKYCIDYYTFLHSYYLTHQTTPTTTPIITPPTTQLSTAQKTTTLETNTPGVTSGLTEVSQNTPSIDQSTNASSLILLSNHINTTSTTFLSCLTSFGMICFPLEPKPHQLLTWKPNHKLLSFNNDYHHNNNTKLMNEIMIQANQYLYSLWETNYISSNQPHVNDNKG